MPDEKYKPVAKCRFYKVCAIYNSNILRDEFEIQMCGKARKPDKRYVPMIPNHPNIATVENCEIWPPLDPCQAFRGYLLEKLLSNAHDLIDNYNNRLLEGKPPLEGLEFTDV